jgi:hypothetical protein
MVVPEKEIDALIEAGWRVLESDYNEAAFLHWRTRAYECLKALVGPSHIYTEHFKTSMAEPELTTVLCGVGLLAAATLGGSDWGRSAVSIPDDSSDGAKQAGSG